MEGRTIVKTMMAKKNVKSGELADALGYKAKQTFYNWLMSDNMRLDKFASTLDLLGCDVVVVDRETGETYTYSPTQKSPTKPTLEKEQVTQEV